MLETTSPCGQLLRREQPAATLLISGAESCAAKGRIAQEHRSHWQARPFKRLLHDCGFALAVEPPSCKEWNRLREDQALHNEAIALHPAAIAALAPGALGVHIAQIEWNNAKFPMLLMPERPLSRVHSPVNGAQQWLVIERLHFLLELLPKMSDLGLGF